MTALTEAQLSANVASIEARLVTACARANRPRASVQLVAVSKLHPPAAIRLAHRLGLRHFGENYAQELRDKHAELSDCVGLRWHAIGPVQPKNAKYVARAAHAFHALDRLEVAEELSRRRTGEALDCFIEVNIGGEASKAGVPPDSAAAFAAQVRGLANLRLVGLTALPPPAVDSKPHFRAVAALAASLGLSQLSMGTTDDFEVAIEEGATHVRIGTAIFGPRPASP